MTEGDGSKALRAPKVVLLAGGGGGARLAAGLARVLPPENLTIVANSGDDFAHLGLTVCPDVDTILYTLAGIVNPATGWGQVDESWHAMDTVRALGGPDWFSLGDRDLGVHLTRTHLLSSGASLTDVTVQLAERFGVKATVLPMSDRPAPTMIACRDGRTLSFQEWFVREHWQPEVVEVQLPDEARATAQFTRALSAADILIIGPSNPYVSIAPILNCYPVRPIIEDEIDVVVAVSPLIAGEAVKGPTAKMMREWGVPLSAGSIATHYGELITGFVYDERDGEPPNVDGIALTATDTLMQDRADQERLAREVLAFAADLTARAGNGG